MNKVLKHVAAKLTGVRRASETRFDITNVSIQEIPMQPEFNTETEVRVDLRVGASTWVREEEVYKNPVVLSEVKRRIGRMIAKELYSEVSEEVYNLYAMLGQRMYLHSQDPIMEKLREIMNMMEYE